MKKNIKLLVYIGFCACLLLNASSCKEDFLNRKSLTSYSEDDVWTNLNLVESYVNSRYRALPKFYGPTRTRIVPSWVALSAASDETYAQFNYESVFRFNLGQVSPDNPAIDAWAGYYRYIREANIFFERIGAVPGDADMKKRLTGEMRFIRAWCYFDLISRYGGVPLITKSYSLTDDKFTAPRNSYDEVMAFVIKEVDAAAAELPVSYSGADLGRITKGAALALKSRALLYAASPLNNPTNDKARWVAAASAAKAVIDMGVYSLYQGADYKRLFLEKFNSEVILSYNIRADINPQGDIEARLNVMIGPNGYHGYSAYVPSQKVVDTYPMKNGMPITQAGSGYDPSNPYENRDPRFYANILYDGAQFRGRAYESFVGGLDSPQSPIENWNASLTGYNWRKYADESQPVAETVGTDQSWIIFRLGEVYLNYAEAAYQLGDEATAREYLNKIRSRASVKMPDVTATGANLFSAIQLERDLELCFEGFRFFDVRRWKIAMQTENEPLRSVKIEKDGTGKRSYSYFVLQNRKFTAANYLYPIPKSEMDKNKELAQNSGY